MAWTLAYEHDRDGRAVAGDRAALIAAIEGGAEVRVRIDYAEQGPAIFRDMTALWVKDGHVYGQAPPTVSCCFGDVYVNGDTATVGADYPPDGLRFLDNPYWYFEICSTTGHLDKSRWGIADHKLRRRNQDTFAIRWFVRR